MLFLYIGAAIVIGLLTGFVFLSVVIVSRRVTKNIQMRASELLSAYDEIIEKRSTEIQRLNTEIQEKKKELEKNAGFYIDPLAVSKEEEKPKEKTSDIVLAATERISTVRYQDERTADIYTKIRGNFDYSPMDVIKQLSTGEVKDGPATRILKELDFGIIEQLSQLSSDNQLDVLYEALDDEGFLLLEEYKAASKQFRAIGFYDFLKSKAQTEPKNITLRITPSARQRYYPSNVDVIIDDSICEGFQIEANNKLYDFSVRKREIT